MLNSMRKYATGWVVKVLFGVLILSFAVWGIGDVLRAPQTGVALAEVAGSEVDQREVMREFDRRYQELQERAGGGLTRQQAVAFGLLNQALDQTIARRLVDAHARELGLTVSDAELAAAIRDNPALAGPTGFDRSRFDAFLRGAGLSEQAYVEAVRQDTVRSRLVEGLTGAAAAPAIAAERLLAYQGERRRGRALIVEADGSRCPTRTTRRSRPTSTRTRGATRPRAARRDPRRGRAGRPGLRHRRVRGGPAGRVRPPDRGVPHPRRALDRAAPGDGRGGRPGGGGPGRRRETFAAAAAALSAKGVERTELGPLRQGDLPEGSTRSRSRWPRVR
jgi:hypothetical protein